LYAYRERVCLIQLSTRDTDYLVDPLGEVGIEALADLFADPAMEKVFHAAEYDVMCLKRDYGFRFASLFDTMWAARILGWPKVGLGDILTDKFGVQTNKRYQRYNWGKRPLESAAMTYACVDTHYLLPLRQRQRDALVQCGRWEEAQEVFAQVAETESATHSFDPADFWRIKGAHKLSRREQAILRELYAWRDREARRKNAPPFKVLGNQTLVTLATIRPRSASDLSGIRGLRPHHVNRYGDGILRAVKLGLRSKTPDPPPRPPRRSRGERERYNALRNWRKQVAAQRGVEPDVVLGNSVLWALAERKPSSPAELGQVEGLGPWKRRHYGPGILRSLGGLDRRRKSHR
jgi:ribonuclease D